MGRGFLSILRRKKEEILITTKIVTLDIWGENNFEIVTAAQGESNARLLEIHLKEKGAPYNLSGSTCQFRMKKPDGHDVFNDMQILNAQGGVLQMALPYQASAAAGQAIPCEIRILRPDSELRVQGLSLNVLPAANDLQVTSSSEFSALSSKLLESTQAVKDCLNATGQASSKAAAANTAANTANTAAANANSKAQLANTAATNANNAAQACQTATGNAKIATKDAAAAAESANNAAQNANLQGGPILSPVTLTGEAIQTAATAVPFRDLKIYGRGRELPPSGSVINPDRIANPYSVEGLGDNNTVQVSVHGKNYIEPAFWTSKTANGLTISCDRETQIFTLNGTSTKTGTLTTAYVRPFFWKSGEAYTLSVDYLGGSVALANDQSVLIALEGGDENGARLKNPVLANFRLLAKSASMTLTADINAEQRAKTMHVWFWINAAGVKFENYQFRIQVERGKTATAWEPHRGRYTNIPLPSPLYSLPDGSRDVLEKQDGRWGITRRVGAAICDGVNLRASFVGNEADGVIQFNVKPPNTEYRNWRVTYCDKFEFMQTVNSVDGKAFIGSDGSLCFHINKTRANGQATASAVNAWLQQNRIFALYPQKETFEPLPAAAQTVLDKLMTIDGENIIYNSGGSEMEVTMEGAIGYLRDRLDGLADKYVPSGVTSYAGNELDFVSPLAHPFESFRLHGRTNEILSGAKSPDNPASFISLGENAAVAVAFQGKNLSRHTGVLPTTAKGLTISYNSTTQIYTINGTSDATGVLATLGLYHFGWTQGDSYTLSLEHVGGTVRGVNQKSVLLCCHANDKNNQNTGDLSYATMDLCNPVPASLTVDAYTAARGVRMRVWTNVTAAGAVFNNYQFRVQVERGKRATPWEPSRARTVSLNLPAMCSLPDGTSDVLEKQNGAWQIQKNVGKFELPGNESISQTPIVVGKETILITIRNTVSNISADHRGVNIYCNRFPTRPDIFTNDEEGILWTDCIYLRIKHSRFTSTGNGTILPWFNENPTYILYQANPSYSAVDAAVQTQLNALGPDEGRSLVVNSFGAVMEVTLPVPLDVINDRIDSLTAADVGARPNTWLPTAAQISAVPTSRTVNGRSLANNITLTAADVGALTKDSLTSGSNENSSWIKFPDGTMIVTQRFVYTGTVDYSKQVGSQYRTVRFDDIPPFPQSFLSPPCVSVTPVGSYTAGMAETAIPTVSGISSLQFTWPAEVIGVQRLEAHIIAIGRWKHNFIIP